MPSGRTLPHSPYHALLLLSDEKSLLGELPLDCSPALVRAIKTTSAVKNLQQLAQDADLALLQVLLRALGDTWVGKDRWEKGLGAAEQRTLVGRWKMLGCQESRLPPSGSEPVTGSSGDGWRF